MPLVALPCGSFVASANFTCALAVKDADNRPVDVRPLAAAEAFVTADGSTIRELLGLPTGGVANQSLAEATLAPGQATERHYHRESEEIYFVLSGSGSMELDG